uniref:Activator of Hsp90 ATPase AHSA1-like N-terminal domain-containing protein n=1 Tax=Ananas comosus var. bracteatus TaxID=296719 RepID=A0A6V7P5Q3_ANACO|nr:unnamed protein product [Ananas comosus var. bracteatus]
MAKYGEGDKRWIVEERPDGANVHNWHWAERDCLEWSRSLLSSLLSGLVVLDGEGGLSIRTKALEKLDGEAYVNVRKGKVPYLADENAGEDPEVRITVRDDDGPIGRRIKDAFVAKGKPLVLEKLRSYVDAMAKGGPARDELEAKKPTASAAKSDASAAPAAGKPAAAAPAAASAAPQKKEKPKPKEGFKTITLTERFYCRTKDVYEILMDENRWKGFTQSNARISKEVGGQFSLFDGSITGVHEELQEGKLIVQKWRFSSWPDGIYSTVRLTFDELEPGVAVVKLLQTDVPEEDKYGNATVVENTERGWREHIFHKIRAVFGFGI